MPARFQHASLASGALHVRLATCALPAADVITPPQGQVSNCSCPCQIGFLSLEANSPFLLLGTTEVPLDALNTHVHTRAHMHPHTQLQQQVETQLRSPRHCIFYLLVLTEDAFWARSHGWGTVHREVLSSVTAWQGGYRHCML
ncbi:hypothetical protein P7K49_025991 [Saguinus oedipus]|uniref:Uncharacterized protein n=1 Tax=Saguinus oedipus TaxID=9490 RepID=A0ABQ9UIS0_SAGOE|nr:hypothetical protein P7K49_025991 [Saguinus oedipus]